MEPLYLAPKTLICDFTGDRPDEAQRMVILCDSFCTVEDHLITFTRDFEGKIHADHFPGVRALQVASSGMPPKTPVSNVLEFPLYRSHKEVQDVAA